jgi:hypothetical protein
MFLTLIKLLLVSLFLGGGSAFSQSYSTLTSSGFYQTNVLAYESLYPLWSDGAKKKRWVSLPANTQIETEDPNTWVYPVGTKFWKEFATIDGSFKIETRLMEKTNNGWKFFTFVWNNEQTEAYVWSGNFERRVRELKPGVFHHLPSREMCMSCHSKGKEARAKDPVLGFSATQLDHELPGVNIVWLAMRNKLTQPLPANMGIKGPTLEAKKAMGLLHGNCGHCHNPDGIANQVGMNLNHNVKTKTYEEENAYITTFNKRAQYYFPDPQVSFVRIEPGSAERSILYRRVKSSSFDDIYYSEKMPPAMFGNMSVHEALLESLKAWIESK